jgi:hypothetical protein
MLLLANIVLPIEIDDNEECHPYMDRMSITFQTIQELPPQNDMQNQVIDYVRTLLSPQKGVSQQGSEKESIPEVSPIESEKEISENIPQVSPKESPETSLKEQEKEFPIEEKYKKEIFLQQTSLIESEKEISEKKLSSKKSEKEILSSTESQETSLKEKEVLNTTFKHYKKPRKMYTAKNYDNKGR